MKTKIVLVKDYRLRELESRKYYFIELIRYRLRTLILIALFVWTLPINPSVGEETSISDEADIGFVEWGTKTEQKSSAETGLEDASNSTINTKNTPVKPAKSRKRVEVYSSYDQQVPILRINDKYFDPSGLCSMGVMSEDSNKSIRQRMQRAVQMGFRIFLLRADWQAIQPEETRIDTSRLENLLKYAEDLGLNIILSLELGRAPAWFFKGAEGGDRVVFSYLVDPENEKALGNDGDLRWANGTGVPIIYHPYTLKKISKLLSSLHYSLKDKKALIGWYLSGPVTFAYPGGGRDGVVGMSDYSPYSVNKFYLATGSRLMTYPLPRYSQASRDTRPDFKAFNELRITWKREAFNQIIEELRSLEPDRLIFIGMEPVLNYRNDNGYMALISAPDSSYQLMKKEVDGAIIAFRLSNESFDALPYKTDCSAMHLLLTINQVLRNKKLPLVLIEADNAKPPHTNDIIQLALMLKAAGTYPIWASGFLQKRGYRWSWEEEATIERMQALSLLPPPRRLRRGDVAILDLPGYYSTYYAERNKSLIKALLQLAIHQRTGVLLEVLGLSEITGERPLLNDYVNLILLAPELISSQEAKSWLGPALQIHLAAFRNMGGVIEAVTPMLLHQYELENYRSVLLEDQLRTRYTHRGAVADDLHGADALVVANDPYVFIRINHSYGSRYIDVKLNDWLIKNSPRTEMINVMTSKPERLEISSGIVSFRFGLVSGISNLYLLKDHYVPVSRDFADRRAAIGMSLQSRNMRRSVPSALLMAALLGVTLLWMTFQSQHKSLLQAAELVERRRRMEPIDILDDKEVMAFYKKYLSDQTGSNSTKIINKAKTENDFKQS